MQNLPGFTQLVGGCRMGSQVFGLKPPPGGWGGGEYEITASASGSRSTRPRVDSGDDSLPQQGNLTQFWPDQLLSLCSGPDTASQEGKARVHARL